MTDIGTRLVATIPALGDPANIVTAFTDYHTDIDAKAAVLAASNAFTSTNSFSAATTFSAPVTLSTSTATLLFNDGTNIEGRMLASSGVIYIQSGTSSSDTSAELRLTRNGTATTNISSFKVYADVSAFYGTIFPVTGTSSVPPIQFTQGTNITTLVAGTLEYNGSLFFATPKVNNTTAGRAVVNTSYALIPSSTVTDSISTTSTTTKTSAALGKYIYLAANTAYKVDFAIRISQSLVASGGNGDAAINFRFALPSGTISSDLQYKMAIATLETSRTDTSIYESSSIDIQVKTATNSSTGTEYSVILGSGIIRVGSTAGNAGPTLYMQASNFGGPTSSVSFTTQADSYCIITPIGSTGEINQGGWA